MSHLRLVASNPEPPVDYTLATWHELMQMHICGSCYAPAGTPCYMHKVVPCIEETPSWTRPPKLLGRRYHLLRAEQARKAMKGTT